MQKIIFPVWRNASISAEQFRDALLVAMNSAASPDTIRHLRVCVVDDDVAAAAPYRIESDDNPPDGVVTLWIDSYLQRHDFEAQLAEQVADYSAYLVWESEPLVNHEHIAAPGQRTHGMNEVVFLRRPERLSPEEWMTIWHDSHTQIAIDTQSTFGYRQNVVIRALTGNARRHDAIIEENFPAEAIASRQAFYAAAGDEKLYREREKIMVESCARFIDFDNMDCLPMSEYIVKR